MMEYSIFKDIVIEKLNEYLPEQYKDTGIDVREVNKVNKTLDGISFFSPKPGINVSAMVFIDDMYEAYRKSGDLETVMKDAATNLLAQTETMDRYVSNIDLDNSRDKIIFQLINTEQNRKLLDDIPHREFKDLSVIYRLVADIDENGIASSIIHNSLAERMGITEEEMFQLAAGNTKRLLPTSILKMEDIIKSMLLGEGIPDERADLLIEDTPDNEQLYVITNEKRVNGAVNMLYEDGLHNLAEKLGTDLYIIPSSVHEVIVVSADLGSPKMLAEMVAEINMTEVSLEDRLSNQIYHYDKDLRKISLATDTPNKRLDTVVAETPLVYETEKAR